MNMIRRAETGSRGISELLEEIRGDFLTEVATILAEPLLAECLCGIHLPRIEQIQVCGTMKHSEMQGGGQVATVFHPKLSPPCRLPRHVSRSFDKKFSPPQFQEATSIYLGRPKFGRKKSLSRPLEVVPGPCLG